MRVAWLGVLLVLAGCGPDMNEVVALETARSAPLVRIESRNAPSAAVLKADYLNCKAKSSYPSEQANRYCSCLSENIGNYVTAAQHSEIDIYAARSPSRAELFSKYPAVARIALECRDRSPFTNYAHIPLSGQAAPTNISLVPSSPPVGSTSASSTGAVGFDASSVPMLSDANRKKLEAYYVQSRPKALAISSNGGYAYNSIAANDAEAIRLAMERCEFLNNRHCALYALNDTVVYAGAR